MRSLDDICEEYEFLEGDERYRLLIELGRDLEPMPEALKTDATLVRGCSAQVWLYPTQQGNSLHFLADSNAAITKGIVALVIAAVQDQDAGTVAEMDILERLAPFDLQNQLSSNRTQGVPNMIALVREHAQRIVSSPDTAASARATSALASTPSTSASTFATSAATNTTNTTNTTDNDGGR